MSLFIQVSLLLKENPELLHESYKVLDCITPSFFSILIFISQVSLLLKENPELLHESYKVCKVLDCIVPSFFSILIFISGFAAVKRKPRVATRVVQGV